MQLLAVFVATLAFAATALAQPPRGPMPQRGMIPPHEAIIEQLKLTEAQQDQMKKLRLDLMKKQTALRSKVQTLRLEIQEHFLADKIDRAAIEKNMNAISDAQHQMKLNMLAHWFDVNSILTPEQQKIWKNAPMAFGQQMRHGMREGMRRMMQHRGWINPDDDDES